MIGLTVVALATSMPELVVTVSAGLAGRPELGIGNVVGSNIANILLIVGVIGLISAVQPPAGMARRDGLVMMGATILFVVLAFTGPLSWMHGVLLLGLLSAYIYGSYRSERRTPDQVEDDSSAESMTHAPSSLAGALGLLALGAVGLAIGSDLLIDGAVHIAQSIGVSDAVIGLTLVAVGTSLPELATAVVSAWRRHAEVALGNAVGSNIFNILGIVGALALTVPVDMSQAMLAPDVTVLLGVTALLLGLLWIRRTIGRPVGFLLLVGYVVFVTTQFVG